MENCAKCKYKVGNTCIDTDCFKRNYVDELLKEKIKESCEKVKENLNKINDKLEGNKEKVEEKKYLKTWEAIKALEEGKKIARIDSKNVYLFIDDEGFFRSESGRRIYFESIVENDKWKIYEEEAKKEIPKEFEGLKYLLASINNLNCSKEDCDICPLGQENCTKLDDIFFDMKEKYEF